MNDVEVNAWHDGTVEILVLNGECNGAYLSPERAIEVAKEIISVAEKTIAARPTQGRSFSPGT